MDKYHIMLGQLSCVCGSVRISNFQIYIRKTNVFSFAAPGHSVVFIQRWIFKGTSAKLYRKGGGGGGMFLLSVTLHDYIIVIIQSFGCSHYYASGQVAVTIIRSKKGSRTQSMCSRSMVPYTCIAMLYLHVFVCLCNSLK